MERRHPAGIVSENPTITTEVLAGRIGISIRAVEKHLSNLKAKVLLSRIGPDQGGHWEVAGGVGDYFPPFSRLHLTQSI
ncbi:MAG: winged helix-turn-helix transcriptional regulator [Bacteroidales bacterium]|nr:winged helix-turn-helix transcriptional regulator [Bacteroidales bacterium]